MILKLVGLFHTIHSSFLILFPIFFNSIFLDIIYINYFFAIIFSYTFIRGECPISYACKKMLDENYIAGQNLTHYPEMLEIFVNDKEVQKYLFITTYLYLCSLLYVIDRSNITLNTLLFSFSIIFIYFLFTRIFHLNKNTKVFTFVQEVTKVISLLTIVYVSMFYK
jgi:hypothetical protein